MNVPGSEPVLISEEVLNTELPLSHVVVLPYSSRLVLEEGSLRTELSWPSEIALHAGVIALKQHDDAELIVIGEDAYKGLDNTTDLTIERAVTAYGVDRDSIRPVYKLANGKLLNNTYRQMAGAAQNLATINSPNVLVVAFEPHLRRVMQASQGAHLLANFVSVEEVLRASDIQSYDDMLPLIAGIGRTERIKRAIGQERGILLNALSDTGLVGPIYLDIDEATGELIEMSTIKRRKQLERELAINSTVTQ